ncbi:stress responsive A/B barrel domain-containing protein [Verticillium alfalfae VaMs.102]|uniref:Stress responsive A/B barrel domain-containing protein n=1 Tax=Verticillium alfalfae (strain VaMs.102 / ATCC MYA-4576 / FGSC 10136) TaxID=526221 RepID=C9SYB1_VERA1|nr:stress responsive A/B barrel domain-containing protein [Verticillium alfalfae VaMs.102]EEY23776.1 stress responsive A/B barrel domain-containing protein [Verticillium alfalfae VaMs.102]
MLPRGLKSVILVVVLLLIALGVYLSPLQVHVPYDLLPSIAMGPITHLVLFQFKEDASSSAIRDDAAAEGQLRPPHQRHSLHRVRQGRQG